MENHVKELSNNNIIAEAVNLKASYGDRMILKGVNLEIPNGKITTIIGGSGSGKTTLLKHFIGLQRQVDGEVTIFGNSWLEMDEKKRESTQQKIGVLFQNGALLGSKTIETNIAIPLEQHTKLPASVISRVVRLKLRQVGLQSAADRMPAELSGGMRKRAALARALALDPPLLFCDEPSAGLDPVTSFQLDRLLLDLRDSLGLTIVVVTHEISSIQRIADRIAYLEDGEMIFTGSLEEAVSDSPESVNNFFSTGGLTELTLKQD